MAVPIIADRAARTARRHLAGQTKDALLIGYGNVGRGVHVHLLKGGLGFRLVGIADRDPAARSEAKGEGVPVFESPEVALDTLRVDCAVIATWPSVQLSLVKECLRRGVHVICEKPVALQGADATAVEALAHSLALGLVPCYQYLFAPGVRKLSRLCHDPRFGRVEYVGIEVERVGARQSRIDRPQWRVASATVGGGITIDYGTHAVYLSNAIHGDVPFGVTIYARRKGTSSATRYGMNSSFELHYNGGSTGVSLTWEGQRRRFNIEVRSAQHWALLAEDELTTDCDLAGFGKLCPGALSDRSDHMDWYVPLYRYARSRAFAGVSRDLAWPAVVRTVEAVAAAESDVKRENQFIRLSVTGNCTTRGQTEDRNR